MFCISLGTGRKWPTGSDDILITFNQTITSYTSVCVTINLSPFNNEKFSLFLNLPQLNDYEVELIPNIKYCNISIKSTNADFLKNMHYYIPPKD